MSHAPIILGLSKGFPSMDHVIPLLTRTSSYNAKDKKVQVQYMFLYSE